MRLKGSTVEFDYTIENSDSDLDIVAYLYSAAPPTYSTLSGTLVLSEISIDQIGPETWTGTISYGDPDLSRNQEQKDTGDSEWSFSTLAGTEHIELGLQPNVGYTVPGGPPRPDTKNIIGLSKKGKDVEVEGVDILVPQSKFSETHYLPASLVDIGYYKTCSDLTGTTNDAQFRGFDVGEVLFGGASGTRRGRGDWAVTFEFLTSKNKSNFQVGQIPVAWKPGWEYLWAMYAPQINNNTLIRDAEHAFVSVVYEQGDFSLLQIGTT